MEATTVMENNECLTAHDCTFVWKITNFSNRCKEVGEAIESPIFTAGDLVSDKIQWKLRLYPFGSSETFKNYLSLFLKCILKDIVDECDAIYNFALSKNNYINLRTTSTKFSKKASEWGYNKLIFRDLEKMKNQLLISGNDTLSIQCSISNITPHYTNGLIQNIELIRGFESLYLCENSGDVSIEVDHKILKAHKIILSARSEVFSAMFKHDTVENKTGIIKVTDVSYDIMKEILRFIYCGKVQNLDMHKTALLAAADKYNLVLLKDSCEEAFWKSFSIDNVCEILEIADLYRFYELKTGALKFMIANIKEACKTSEFFESLESNPVLLVDIFCNTVLTKKCS